MNAKTEAIANADAHLNNAGLPTYTELTGALIVALRHAREAMPANERAEFDSGKRGPEWMFLVKSTIARAIAD